MAGQLLRKRGPDGRVLPLTENEVTLRFWARVARGAPDECWPYMGRINREYGAFISDGHTVMAHRFAYEVSKGAIPRGLHVLHLCDNPPCCNPAHLGVGSPADNARERVERGRERRGSQRPGAKLTEDEARHIRAMLNSGMSQRAIAREYGMSHATIGELARRITWSHV